MNTKSILFYAKCTSIEKFKIQNIPSTENQSSDLIFVADCLCRYSKNTELDITKPSQAT